MAMRSKFHKKDTWEGRHKSFIQKIEGQYKFEPRQIPRAERLDEYNRMTKELQSMIGHAVQSNTTLRAMGSWWSLSKVAMTNDRLLNTKNLSLAFDLGAKHISPQYRGDYTKLRFVETGAEIVTINRYLFQQELSLKASGSNDGQTLAGVISTNTHGSAFKFGSTQDFVVGLHLITGPNKHVYLQRSSRQVIKESFAKKLGAKLINDDALFNSALVSFGSFGIIHGMMIEARNRFLLHASREFLDFDQALRTAISTLTFAEYKPYFTKLEKRAFKRNKFHVPFSDKNLYHFQVTFNPNEIKKDKKRPKQAAVFFMFESKYRSDYEPTPWDQGAAGPGASGLELMGELFELSFGPIKKLTKSQINDSVRELFQYDLTGTFLDLFRGEKTRGKVYASGIGLDISHALKALDIAFDTYKHFGKIMPILITIRFLKETKAVLGFTKFPKTCVMEIDGINTENTQIFANKVWKRIDAAGIPFTMHWGKMNSYLWSKPGVVRKMYGDSKVQTWIDSREKLLTPEVRKVFTNDFLRRVRLAT